MSLFAVKTVFNYGYLGPCTVYCTNPTLHYITVRMTKKKENGKRKKMGQKQRVVDENRMTEHTHVVKQKAP